MHTTPARSQPPRAQARARSTSGRPAFRRKYASSAPPISDQVGVRVGARTDRQSRRSTHRRSRRRCRPLARREARQASARLPRFTSTTYFSRTPGCRARFAAWILPMRPAPNTATSIVFAASVIVSSSVFGFFYVQFELVRERDEQRLAQADRAGQRAERKRAAFLHIQLSSGVTRRAAKAGYR